jgi:glycosyltransferase involved in cell wall biosynthesis
MTGVTRCDLHLHSNASVGGDEWYTQHFGCPESYAEPVKQYELAKARGMDLVTLTDHDTIAGGLQLIDRPDFFLSEEVTAKIPEDDCIIHVLTWNISPEQHEEIQARRDDCYQLVEYLQKERIAHGLAHPLLSMNWKLDAKALEKLILLFPTWESMNGLVDARMQRDLQAILGGLDEDVIRKLEREHGIKAAGKAPFKKAISGGSDDHVHRRAAAVFTELDGAIKRPVDFLERVLAGEARVGGKQADLNSMALTISHTAFTFLSSRRSEQPDYVDPFVDLVEVLNGTTNRSSKGVKTPAPGKGARADFVRALLDAAKTAGVELGHDKDVLYVDGPPSLERDAAVANGIARLNDRLFEKALEDAWAAVSDFDLYKLLGAGRDLTGALLIVGPFLGAADHFAKQERQVVRIREQWTAFPLPERKERLAIFSDSLDQVDGVSQSCKRFVEQAKRAGRDVLVPYCGDNEPIGGVARDYCEAATGASFVRLPRAAKLTAPLYQSYTFYLPSLVGALEWMWREQITHVELATPGPMGLVGLIAAKLLKLPVTASYHTEVPGIIQTASENPFLVKAAKKYLGWFYHRVDRVFAFSSASRDKIVDMGVPADRIQVLPVSIDPTEFSPTHQSPDVFRALELEIRDRPVVLSVGRLSKEKNLHVVIEAVERLQHLSPPPVLLLVGDGPEREALEAQAAGKEFVKFVGVQHGETLAKIYASSNLFVFASRIDTLGLVAMEAMLSGAPLLLPRDASIAEFITHCDTGYCYEFGAPGLSRAIEDILDDPQLARGLAQNARRVMIDRWNRDGFATTWGAMTARS